jgi:copper homeostasis protein
LTSGQARSAHEGIPLIKELVAAAQGKIIIMAGAGINPENVVDIITQTGVEELHGTAGILVHGAPSNVNNTFFFF